MTTTFIAITDTKDDSANVWEAPSHEGLRVTLEGYAQDTAFDEDVVNEINTARVFEVKAAVTTFCVGVRIGKEAE